MCSCRWAHTRWAVTRKPKYSPRPRYVYTWVERHTFESGVLLGPLACLKHIWCILRSSYRSRNVFSSGPTFLCSVSTSTLSRMRTQSHTRKRKIHVASPMSCLTRTNWYSLENTNKLLLPFLQLARKAKILFWPRVFVQITEALAFMRQRKLYSTMLVTAERKNVPNSFPPSSWLVINQLLLFLLFFSFILRTERSITETFLSW